MADPERICIYCGAWDGCYDWCTGPCCTEIEEDEDIDEGEDE